MPHDPSVPKHRPSSRAPRRVESSLRFRIVARGSLRFCAARFADCEGLALSELFGDETLRRRSSARGGAPYAERKRWFVRAEQQRARRRTQQRQR